MHLAAPVDQAEAPEVAVGRVGERAARGAGRGEAADGLVGDAAGVLQRPALLGRELPEQAGLQRRRAGGVARVGAEVDAGVRLDQLAALVADAPAAVAVEHQVHVRAGRRRLHADPARRRPGGIGVDRVRDRVRRAAHAQLPAFPVGGLDQVDQLLLGGRVVEAVGGRRWRGVAHVEAAAYCCQRARSTRRALPEVISSAFSSP